MSDLTPEEREVEGMGLADGWKRVESPGHIVVFERDDEHTHSELTYYRRDKDISIRVTEKSDNSYGFVSADFAGLLSVLNAVRLAAVEVATPAEGGQDG